MKYSMYRPLPDFVTIKKSPLHGHGLFATRKIKSGEWIGVIHVPVDKWIPSDLPHNFKQGFIRTPLGGFGNHSDNSNCVKFLCYDVWWIKAGRRIEKDEELTWKYTLYDVS